MGGLSGTVPRTRPFGHEQLTDMPEPLLFSIQNDDHDPRYNMVFDGGEMGIEDAMSRLRNNKILDGGLL